MNIPRCFKISQKRVFQDKTFFHYKPRVITGTLGSVTTVPDRKMRRMYTANVQYVANKTIAEEYGLKIGIDIQITSSNPLCILKGDFLEYRNDLYKVTETPKFDSYCAYYAERE